MNGNRSRTNLVRGAAVLSVFGLLGVLVYLLVQLGYSQSRFVLLSLIASSAVIGGIGVTLNRTILTMIGAVGLFLLGFWQAVLSIYIAPVIALLLLAAFLDRTHTTEVDLS